MNTRIRTYTDLTAAILYAIGNASTSLLWYYVGIAILTQYGLKYRPIWTVIATCLFFGTYFYHLRKYGKTLNYNNHYI